MMRATWLLISLVGMVAFPGVLHPGRLDGGDIQGLAVSWEPSHCYKPTAPYFISNDYRSHVAEHNDFVARAQDYLYCVEREAKKDMEAFQRLLLESLQRINDDMLADVRRSKDSLDFMR